MLVKLPAHFYFPYKNTGIMEMWEFSSIYLHSTKTQQSNNCF